MEWAAKSGVPCEVGRFPLAQLLQADEIFLVNSVIGLWPVRELQTRIWDRHPLSHQVQEWLDNAHD
jgi:4-amino-4-deoxychorismate lyase